MDLRVFGSVHIIYLAITFSLSFAALFLAKKYAKTEKSQKIFLKSLAVLLFIWILINRLSQVFRYSDVHWELIIPDSFCGMTSLVLSLAVIFGKKDNDVLHFVWLLGIFGGVSTVIYPAFIGQGPTIFYLPTISGLLHHSLSAMVVVALVAFNWIKLTYKKWYCTLFGFTCYLAFGAFLIGCMGMSDAFHIYTPLLDGTPLTTWVMAPIYIVCYSLILLIIELVRKNKSKTNI